MADLADFVIRRIAHDEYLARMAAEAVIGPDELGMSGGTNWTVAIGGAIRARNGATVALQGRDASDDVTNHIARHDPEHVLAECTAKRKLWHWAKEGGNHFVMCQLAVPYDDHPDWCEDWRP
jgi:hypothetical protein